MGKFALSKTVVIRSVVVAIGVLVAIQFVQPKLTNPPVETEIPAPPEVRALLQRACYDCHSNKTVWPQYSRIAPISWLLAWDVHEGRQEMNFTTWNRLTAEKQAKKLKECVKEISEGDMPPWTYRIAHPQARLSPAEKELLQNWATSASTR